MQATGNRVMPLPRGKKTTTLHIRVPADMAALIQKRAKHERRDPTDYARYLLYLALFGVAGADRMMADDDDE